MFTAAETWKKPWHKLKFNYLLLDLEIINCKITSSMKTALFPCRIKQQTNCQLHRRRSNLRSAKKDTWSQVKEDRNKLKKKSIDVRARRCCIVGWCKENKEKNKTEQPRSALIKVVNAFPLRLFREGLWRNDFPLMIKLINSSLIKFVPAKETRRRPVN